jgi:hypothetical protein
MQLINLCLTNSQILLKQKISKHKLLALYQVCSQKPEYEYFFLTVKFLYIKLAIKYLTLNMMDEALYLGTRTNLQEILSYCRSFATYQKDTIALNVL